MRIEIVTTSNDDLKETGFGSYKACENILEAIDRMGHTAALTVCQSLSDLDKIVKRNPGLVVLAVKYISINGGDDIWLSEYFSENGIAYSGSSRETLRYDSDKVLAKSHLRTDGIKTANFFTAIPGQYKNEGDLPFTFPLFLKPTDAANGNGIDDLSLVNNLLEFEAKVLSLYEMYKQPVLVEEYLNGREFTVAIIKATNGVMIVSAIEIVPPESLIGLRILGQKVKQEDSEDLKEIEGAQLLSDVKSLAVAAFFSLGVRGYGRIDVKLDNNGQCYFMEANLVPGMNFGSSYFPQACEIANKLSYDQVINLMLEESISRVAVGKMQNKVLNQCSC